MHTILVHAFPLNSLMWSPQHAAFPGMITPDLPGFGMAAPPFGESFSMAAAARSVLHHLEAHGIERCILGGLSMGGYVALECWRQFPGRIAGMILADTRAGADSPQVFAGRYAAAERIKYGGYEAYCGAMTEKLLWEQTLRERPEVVTAVRTMMSETLPESAVAGLYAMAARPDSTELLATISVPVMVIVGQYDSVTPVEEAEAMVAALPSATLAIIPNAGHLSNLENPESFNQALSVIFRDSGGTP